MKITVKKADFYRFGNRKTKDGIVFCATLSHKEKCGIVIYDEMTLMEKDIIQFDNSFSLGDVYSVCITGIDENCLYRYFCDSDIFIDPYAPVFNKVIEYGQPVNNTDLFSRIASDSYIRGFDKDITPNISYSDSVFYLLHVRGFSMLNKGLKEKGTFKAISKKISYFKDLNVTSLMLMPCYEFVECEDRENIPDQISYKTDITSKPAVNYWGFKKGFYFSPKQNYCFTDDSTKEFSEMIYLLHKNNIEVLMMMYFEADTSIEFILSVLRFYVMNFHIDGFRIQGSMINEEAIVKDPFLKKTKLIFDSIDAGRFYNSDNSLSTNIAYINSEYSNVSKRFIKGDEDTVSTISFLLRENTKECFPLRNVSDYNGFTINDCYTYNFKHNEDNNEDNSDGTNFNYSWNCGVEGPSRKATINKLRNKMAKNAMLMSMLAQGAPLIVNGDEWLNSSKGNNNPWCQDNEIGWVNYSNNKNSKDFYEFTKSLIAFRKKHTILHQPKALRLYDYLAVKLPDISFHSESPFKMNQDTLSRSFAMLLCGDYARTYTDKAEDSIYIIFNMYWEDVKFALPVTGEGYEWKYLFNSSKEYASYFDEENAPIYESTDFLASPRSISIFILRKHIR